MIAQLDKEYIKTRPLKVWSRMVSYTLFEGRPLTTKGRWINPAVFCLLKTLSNLPRTNKVRAPVFILGTGRSGSTIMGKVLSMHKELAFLNEPKAIWATLHENEDLIGSYNKSPCRYRLEEHDASDKLIKKAHRIFGGVLLLSMQKRVVDKYPELIFRTPFVSRIFPDAQYIFLSRDVDSTCTSIKFWSERKGCESAEGTADWWGLNDRKWHALVEQLVSEHSDIAVHRDQFESLSEEGRAAIEWAITMREGIKLCKENSAAVIHMPYDELCSNSTGWMSKLTRFLNLEHDGIFDEYAQQTLTAPATHDQIELPNWLREITNQIECELSEIGEL